MKNNEEQFDTLMIWADGIIFNNIPIVAFWGFLIIAGFSQIISLDLAATTGPILLLIQTSIFILRRLFS